MAAGGYRHRLDHQMGVGQMREQFVPIAIGDLDGQLGNVPAPLIGGRTEGVKIGHSSGSCPHWIAIGIRLAPPGGTANSAIGCQAYLASPP